MLEALVCCYGDRLDIIEKTFKQIVARAAKPSELRLIVGINQGSPAVVSYLRELADGNVIDVLVESRQNRNKDAMMRVLIEHVQNEFFCWFDDDTYPEAAGWDTRVNAIIAPGNFEVAGFVHVTHRDTYVGYKAFLAARPWFKSWEAFGTDATLTTSAVFPHGAFWIARTGFLRQHDYPDRGMVKKADDMLLGELCAQQEGRLKNIGDLWHDGRENSTGAIRVNTGPRRGTGEGTDDGFPNITLPSQKKFDGLTIYPTGGMCNRLRNIISAAVLCWQEKVSLRIVNELGSSQIGSVDLSDFWAIGQQWASHFKQAGLTITMESMPVGELMEMHHKAQKDGNLHLRLPRGKLRGAYHNHWGLACLEGEQVTENRLRAGLRRPGVGELSVLELTPRWRQILSGHLPMVDFSNGVIGVHVRAFEFLFGERQPEQLDRVAENFFKHLDPNPAARILLATDSKRIRELFIKRYGDRVLGEQTVTGADFIPRDTRSGFESGVVDLYTLARCSSILGTKGSSFSQLAGIMAGKITWIEGVRNAKEWEG